MERAEEGRAPFAISNLCRLTDNARGFLCSTGGMDGGVGIVMPDVPHTQYFCYNTHMKSKAFIVLGITLVAIFGVLIFATQKTSTPDVQSVLGETLAVSKQYVALRYRTNTVLVTAEHYPSYAEWRSDMQDLIAEWKVFDTHAATLEQQARLMSEQAEPLSLSLLSKAYAYDHQEISNVFDKAPAGKKIATLAKYLGVDAKKAYKILQQDQDQVTADAWNEAGDTFKKLETSATVIKDSCKVVGFVGGIIATGGTSALASASALSQAAVVVSGADLALEVTSDGAKIGLGDQNKISTVIDSARVVTEPISSILSITSAPENIGTNFEKFSAVMVGVEQFNSAAQDGKIVGIALPVYTNDRTKTPVTVSVLDKSEYAKWLADHNAKAGTLTTAEIEQVLGIIQKATDEQKIVGEARVREAEKELNATGTVAQLLNTDNGTNAVYISTPEGPTFTPAQGLMFQATLRNPESMLTKGKNTPVWCHWKFFLNNTLYSDKVNPSMMTTDTKNICGYGTMLIKTSGLVRVEFYLERGTKSKYADEPTHQSFTEVKREYYSDIKG